MPPCQTKRAPLAPCGWPSALRPPLAARSGVLAQPPPRVAHKPPQHTAHHTAEKRDGGEQAGGPDAHMPLGFQISRQPCAVDPGDIDAAEVAQDHPPAATKSEQVPPLAECH